MKAGRISLAALVVLLVAVIGAAGCSEMQMSEMDDQGQSKEKSQNQTETSEMAHSGMDGGQMDMTSMLMEDGEYSDEKFIDAMVPHHRGAVEMAEVALDNAEHEELISLSEDVVRTQNVEIRELRDIKQEEFGTSEIPGQMSEMEMQMMSMSDPAELARQEPFDLAFIEEMIPHHQSAIEMARVALENSDDPRITALAQDIISAQEREISEMRQWKSEWYPKG